MIRKLLVIKEAIIEWGNQPAIVGELNLDFSLTENCGFSEVWILAESEVPVRGVGKATEVASTVEP